MRTSRTTDTGGSNISAFAARTIAPIREKRDRLLRRIAFGLEATDRLLLHREVRDLRTNGPVDPADCTLLAVIAHWRDPSAVFDPAGSAPLFACLRGLLDLPVAGLEIVIATNDDAAVAGAITTHLGPLVEQEVVIQRAPWSEPNDGRRVVTVERWAPRWPYRHGFYLTWHHKDVFRRALRTDGFTHLLYLEDDIAFTEANLRYWLTARQQLAERGMLPGFVRFERRGEARLLVDQTRSGQHEDAGPPITVEGWGEVAVRNSRRPYQACSLLDRELAREHLRSSPMRSPLRSNVSTWNVRERAAAGEVFGPTVAPMQAILRPSAARPPTRHAVLTTRDGATAGTPVEGALVEHLRAVYSMDPSSRHGKVLVEQF